MLKKVLKYDLKFVLKFWWIGAVACLALSVLGGIGIYLQEMNTYVKELPFAVNLFSYIAIILAVMGFFAFSFLSEVLVIVRMYKNFFTDEGYLTFTLPVKKSTLLNSKLLTSFIATVLTVITAHVNLFIMLCIPFHKDIFSRFFIEDLREFFTEIIDVLSVKYFVIYIIEVLAVLSLITLISILVIYICMSIGSLIAKKGKVLVSFGIYYVFTNALTSIVFIFMTVVAEPLINWIDKLDQENGPLFLLLVLIFGFAICLLGFIGAILYTLQYRLLDKKLNLQ